MPHCRAHTLLRAVATLCAAATTLAVLVVAPGQPATAATPVPPTPTGLPAMAEQLAAYVGANSCDASAKPGATALGNLLTRTYTGTSFHVTRPCGADSLATSEHYDGRAVDWAVSVRNSTQRSYATAALNWMLATDAKGNAYANARRLGVMYIIWNNQSWSSYRAAEGWKEYGGCSDASKAGTAYDTVCHRDHVHVSLSWAGAMQRSSFWSKTVAQQEFGPCRTWHLNWATPSTRANLSRCAAPAKVTALPSTTTLGKQLVGYSGMYLRQGSTGPAVTALQSAIGTAATGTFSATTRSALLSWQSARGLTTTGVTDTATWRVLVRPHAAPPVALGLDADFRSDLLGRRPDGTLVLHTSGSESSGRVLGTGWQAFNLLVAPGDFTGDTHPDLLARKPDGTLWLYAGTGTGSFRSGARIGAGWQGFDQVLSPGDFTGDSFPDLLARKPDGTLWLYAGNGRGGWAASGMRIGAGWQVFNQVLSPGDFTGDGRGDVLARKPDGTLWLYAGNGRGGWAAAGTKMGGGWQAFSQALPGGDRNGDGAADVLALRPDGVLLSFAGNGRGGWASGGQVIGYRWDRYNLVVGVR
jgi:hypothetical protein